MAHYLFYWKPDTVDDVPDGAPLLYGASEQFERLASGDVLWLVTSRSRASLTLVGRLSVVRVTDSRSDAQVWVGRDDLWEASWYALADKDQAVTKREFDISDFALRLTFDGTPSGLPTGFSGQHLQSMRKLLPQAMALLERAWATASSSAVALPLSLHARYGRKDIYEVFGIEFSQRNRTQIQGLSPRLPDGGYCIFITLDKSGLDEIYDYEDQLYEDSFEWVTRRGPTENHPDYTNLRDPSTRVSLFVRGRDREEFVYLGEVRYITHESFRSDRDRRNQQKYLFSLVHLAPEALLSELAEGVDNRSAQQPSKVSGAATRTKSNRRPTTLAGARKALSYVLGDLNRILVPAHHNYQVRLKDFLAGRGIVAEWERDFVDVRFQLEGQTFIGEVKVTTYLSLDEAFRTALGQLLFYGHVGFENPPELMMLLDQKPDEKRLRLASKLGVSVVVEIEEGKFTLLNPEVAQPLASVF